ncbi:hypothetical protein C8Q70DRAFT_993037 [Cubamyces menziesii]|nr:hypothetical protein C8Q70DRAFT_993037 [Cubamyces menziesii]
MRQFARVQCEGSSRSRNSGFAMAWARRSLQVIARHAKAASSSSPKIRKSTPFESCNTAGRW